MRQPLTGEGFTCCCLESPIPNKFKTNVSGLLVKIMQMQVSIDFDFEAKHVNDTKTNLLDATNTRTDERHAKIYINQ